MTVSNRVVLTFNSDTSEIARISIPRAGLTKTAADARASMEDIISTGIVSTSNGMPSSVHGAEIISTQRTNLVPTA